jgi:hypothetical protein
MGASSRKPADGDAGAAGSTLQPRTAAPPLREFEDASLVRDNDEYRQLLRGALLALCLADWALLALEYDGPFVFESPGVFLPALVLLKVCVTVVALAVLRLDPQYGLLSRCYFEVILGVLCVIACLLHAESGVRAAASAGTVRFAAPLHVLKLFSFFAVLASWISLRPGKVA